MAIPSASIEHPSMILEQDPNATLNLAQLEAMHILVSTNINSWRFYKWAYEGTESLVKYGQALPKHPRESEENYQKRLEYVYGFGYSQAVVDLLTFYLFQQPALHDWGALADDPLFQALQTDADYYGTDFDAFLIEAQKASSIQGHSGIFVDKPLAASPANNQTVADATKAGIYPYVSLYEATNILDWKYERNQAGKPTLTYLKLVDVVDASGDDIILEYRVWTHQLWQLYRVTNGKVERIDTGPNTLGGLIPFTWVFNVKSGKQNIGVSDLKEVAKIDSSIIRNLSQIEEVTDYAAFPMLMRPALAPGDEEDDTAGVTAILEFDPTQPNAMPAWLESAAKEPLEAILTVIYRKVEEIYRSINAGGLNSTEVTKQVKSGVALQQEFRLLNAKLASKSQLLEEAERNVIRFWSIWQAKPEVMKDVKIQRPRDFNISNLIEELETVVLATSVVNSDTYDQGMQKLVVRKTMPDLENYSDIDKEIETYVEPVDPTGPNTTIVDEV